MLGVVNLETIYVKHLKHHLVHSKMHKVLDVIIMIVSITKHTKVKFKENETCELNNFILAY